MFDFLNLKTKDDGQHYALLSIMNLANEHNYQSQHAIYVTRIALTLFDDLRKLHGLDEEDRFYLLCAGLLHDIGVNGNGKKKHHKRALQLIVNNNKLALSSQQRLVIGSIARYHRKALPSKRHAHYRELSHQDRLIVSKLAAILRIADGLDYSHENRVKNVTAKYDDETIVITCSTNHNKINREIRSATKKSDLISLIFQRDVQYELDSD